MPFRQFPQRVLLLTSLVSLVAGAVLGAMGALAGIEAFQRLGRLPSARSPAPVQPAADEPFFEIRRVVDGDTLDVLLDLPGPEEHKIRLLNIDTPERGRPGFAEATATLRELVAGAERVWLDFPGDASPPERDRYGRILAYVFADGVNVNAEIVRLGWSEYDTAFGEGDYPKLFRSAEREAQEARRGLWGR